MFRRERAGRNVEFCKNAETGWVDFAMLNHLVAEDWKVMSKQEKLDYARRGGGGLTGKGEIFEEVSRLRCLYLNDVW